MSAENSLPIVVLISGNGSNLQAIIDAVKSNDLPVDIRAVISNRSSAYGLERARQANIPTEVILFSQYNDAKKYDAALLACINKYQPKLVVLAGFMRIVGPEVVQQFHDCMLNIHPSLLPKYPGLNTHERALADKEAIHGVSIHFVTDELDGGPIIVQAHCKIDPTDTAETLADKVHQLEHVLYPEVIKWYAQGRLRLTSKGVNLDGKVLMQPIEWSCTENTTIGDE